LKDAIDAFIKNGREFVAEDPKSNDSDREFLNSEYQCGIDGEYVVFAIDALKNPASEGFVYMLLSCSEYIDVVKPEIIARITTDTTWNCIRESDNLLNHIDSSRLNVKVSVDNNGRRQFEKMQEQILAGTPKHIELWGMSSKLLKGFKFKVSSNSKSHSGSMNDNIISTAEAMKITHPATYDML